MSLCQVEKREVCRWEHSPAAGFLVAKRMQAKTAHTQLHNGFLLRQTVGLVETQGKECTDCTGSKCPCISFEAAPGKVTCFDHALFPSPQQKVERQCNRSQECFRKLEEQKIEASILQHHKTVKQVNWQVLFQRNKTLESISIALTKAGSCIR